MAPATLVSKDGSEVATVDAPEGIGAVTYDGKLCVDDLNGRYVETSYYFADDAKLEQAELEAAEKVIERGKNPP